MHPHHDPRKVPCPSSKPYHKVVAFHPASLNADVLREIVGYLATNKDPKERKQDLLTCAMVKPMSHGARICLYSHIEVPTCRLQVLLKTVQLRPELGKATLALIVHHPRQGHARDYSLTHPRAMLKSFPNLISLHLMGSWGCGGLQMPSTLRYVTVCGDMTLPYAPSLPAFLGQSRIRELRIHGRRNTRTLSIGVHASVSVEILICSRFTPAWIQAINPAMLVSLTFAVIGRDKVEDWQNIVNWATQLQHVHLDMRGVWPVLPWITLDFGSCILLNSMTLRVGAFEQEEELWMPYGSILSTVPDIAALTVLTSCSAFYMPRLPRWDLIEDSLQAGRSVSLILLEERPPRLGKHDEQESQSVFSQVNMLFRACVYFETCSKLNILIMWGRLCNERQSLHGQDWYEQMIEHVF
jgi:hypothetical protein